MKEALAGRDYALEPDRSDAEPRAAHLTRRPGGRAPQPPPGFWQRGDSHYPQPLSPFARSVLLPAANYGFREMCTAFGLLTETVEEREIGGWVYLRGVPLGGKDRRPLPDWLMRVFSILVPSLRRRIRDCVVAVRTDRAGDWIERWNSDLKVDLVRRLSILQDVLLPALSDEELRTHVVSLAELLRESQRLHMMLNQSLNLLLAEFARASGDILGWDEDKAFEMLAGLSETSSAPSRALAELTGLVQAQPELLDLVLEFRPRAAGESEARPPRMALHEVVVRADVSAAERILAANPSFAAAFADYQREFGRRTIRYEVADPTLAEMPALILSLIGDQIRRGYDPEVDRQALAEQRARLLAEASRLLSERRPSLRRQFERAHDRAAKAYPVREEHGFYDTSIPLALLRYAALEIGRRLVRRKRLLAPSDVFFLEMEEAVAALCADGSQRDRVELRRRELDWVRMHPGPASYGERPASPSLAWLPAEARSVHEALMWSFDRIFAPSAGFRQQSDGLLLRGTAASSGRYTGPVRVIRGESEFDRIEPGDVLVCPITSPVWTAVFPSVGALVTDAGGFLSHSAIIAREYRIPAVVAVGNATSILHDGQIVTVDGGSGTVTVEALPPTTHN